MFLCILIQPYPDTDQNRYESKLNMDQFNSLLRKWHIQLSLSLLYLFITIENMELSKFKIDKRFTFLYKYTKCTSVLDRGQIR